MPASPSGVMTAILPCNDLDASEAFYARLGFLQPEEERGQHADYRMLTNGQGGFLHLTPAVEGWLVPGQNPFGLYLYAENIDELAKTFVGETIEKTAPHDKPWGMTEFSLSDPDQTLVRVGWPTRLRAPK